MGDQERPDMSDRPELEHGKRFDVRDEPADALESDEGHAVKRYVTDSNDEPPSDDTEGHGHWKGG